MQSRLPFFAEEEVKNTTLILLLFNIFEAAIQLAHQFAHHFFDCNSYQI